MEVLLYSNRMAVVEAVSHAFGHMGARLTVCEFGLEPLRAVEAGAW